MGLKTAIRFITKSQNADGSFTGFFLPPGSSNDWITAHVAFVLENVPSLVSVCQNAAHYLSTTGDRRLGWGYNHRVRVDLDSCAQAIMVLHRHGFRIPPTLINYLIVAQENEGGFPTFPRSNRSVQIGWEMAHADVTLMVVEMLRRLNLCKMERVRAINWLYSYSVKEEIQAYWWNMPSYILWAQSKADFRADAASVNAHSLLDEPADNPHLAMALSAYLNKGKLDAKCNQAIRTIMSQQCEDGSWRCSPCLRVTDPRESIPGPTSKGTVYLDRRRIFSTAHAVAALTQAQKILGDGLGV
jgi:hypothetical protein